MSSMKTINVDADPKNANWPKRTKDVTDYPLLPVPTGKVRTPSASVAAAAKKSRKKQR